MAHQGAQMPKSELWPYINWLEDFEYNKLGVIKPEITFFLDLPPPISQKLAVNRGRTTADGKLDIHEAAEQYMEKVYYTYKEIAEKRGWIVIPCSENGKLRSIHKISETIWKELATHLSSL